MSQSNFGTIDPSTKSGSQLATDLNSWRNALHSNHSGSSRPSYVTAGMIWLDTTANPQLLKFYDGADDITLLSINTTTKVAVPANLTIANASVTLAMLAVQAANTALVNITGSNASPTALAFAANKFLARASTGNLDTKDISDVALTLLAQTSQANMRSVGLGLGSMAVQDASAVAITGGSISGVAGIANDYPFIAAYNWSNTSTLDITLPSSHDYFDLDFIGVGIDQNRSLWARFDNGSGTFYASTGQYVSANKRETLTSTPTVVNSDNSGDSKIPIFTRRSLTYGGFEGLHGTMRIRNDAAGTPARYAGIEWDLWHRNGYTSNSNNGEPDHSIGFGSQVASLVRSSKLRLMLDSGSVVTGKLVLRGRRTA